MAAAAKKRRAVSPKVRFEVFKRDTFMCIYCGDHPPSALLQVDHVIPVAGGGGNDIDNLVTACSVCNIGKGARLLSVAPASLEEKAKEIAEREAQLRGYQKVMEARLERVEDEKWRVAELFMEAHGKERILKTHLASIRKFNELLGVHEVLEAMGLAIVKFPWGEGRCFRYFCGICWRKVRGE